MFRALLGIAVCLVCLAGCANGPVVPEMAQLPWRDKAFNHDPAGVTVGKEDLFRLDPGLLALVNGRELQATSPQYRLKHLMTLIFGPDLKGFGYEAGHSTPAQETWRLRKGDCLSLTVLAYAAAKAMGLDAQMQEVRIPVTFDRRDQLDLVNQHVNVLFRGAHRGLRDSQAQDVVVDFDPGVASRRPGLALTEDAVLARYYNNVGAEHLAKRRWGAAYAHFKAAIRTDPAYAAGYGNLAVLYLQADLRPEAEQLLRHAIALGHPPDVPAHTLHKLLVEQGRTVEAQRLERTIEQARERDPYHWIALGVRQLEEGNVRGAIDILERARAMASGFDEIHRYLAIAYWRAGDDARAREQMAILGKTGDKLGLAMLQRKMQATGR